MQLLSSEVLNEIVSRLVKRLQPEKIIPFGSHAYGGPTVDSDIDLLIILSDSDQPHHRRASHAYEFLWGLTAPTELLVLTHQEVEKRVTVKNSLVNEAVNRGRVLYE
ncbi:MAG: nucleotidyltransferase domain-containing protein [Timaviella obliquedivisa GSE-PSE-MK23-08B]|jgi:predicted nucleotidyltransferase|nr:nucleotidyltransferase domain-containing protein [Timaviella obliquedivisa GSE-PSE-MK23-08B]